MREPLITAALLLAPLVALVACVSAVRRLPHALARPWLVLALSALAATLAPLSPAAAPAPAAAILVIVAMALFALGLGWILLLRDRQRPFEIALDAGLVMAAVAVVLLRWSPALPAAGTTASPTVILTLFGGPTTAACAAAFSIVLLVARGRASTGALATMLALSAITLGLAMAPVALGYPACCTGRTLGSIPYMLGWSSLAAAAYYAGRRGSRAFRSYVGADAGGSRLRLVVAPVIAIVLGAIAIDAAWRGQLRQPTAVAVAALGALLALRVTQLLFATRSPSAERTQLDQSNALIELSHALSATTDLQETLDRVAQWAVKLLDGRGAAIELLTDDGLMLEFRAIHGLPEDLLRLRLPVDGSFTGWVVQNGQPRYAPDPHTDPYMSAVSLRYLGDSPVAAAPLRYRDRTLGALTCSGRFPFDATELELLRALADQAAVAIANARLFQEVHQLSLTDPLTGLPNRRQLERDLHREFAAARRGRRLVVVMFDLNGFKEYNDRYGHVAGDEALRLFARALAAETRTMNMAARYGGDEFIAVLGDADLAGAQIFLDRVRERFPGPNATARERELSVAAGMAAYTGEMKTTEQLVAAADAALYSHKQELRQQREELRKSVSA